MKKKAIGMVPGVITKIMAGVDDRSHEIGMGCGAGANQKKGRMTVVVCQDFQDPRCHLGIRPVIESQGNSVSVITDLVEATPI